MKVAIVMGSASDMPIAKKAEAVLEETPQIPNGRIVKDMDMEHIHFLYDRV